MNYFVPLRGYTIYKKEIIRASLKSPQIEQSETFEEVKEEIVVTPIEEVVTQDQEVPSQEEQHVEEAAPVETYSKAEFEALQMENAQLADKCATLTQDRNLNKERAEQSEIREEQLKQRNEELSEMLTQKYEEINKLTAQLNIANKTVNQEELTLDKALDYIKDLGYEAFIRKL